MWCTYMLVTINSHLDLIIWDQRLTERLSRSGESVGQSFGNCLDCVNWNVNIYVSAISLFEILDYIRIHKREEISIVGLTPLLGFWIM